MVQAVDFVPFGNGIVCAHHSVQLHLLQFLDASSALVLQKSSNFLNNIQKFHILHYNSLHKTHRQVEIKLNLCVLCVFTFCSFSFVLVTNNYTDSLIMGNACNKAIAHYPTLMYFLFLISFCILIHN